MKKSSIILLLISLFTLSLSLSVLAGTTPPLISDTDYSPRIPTTEDEVIVTTSVIDNESGVDFVTLQYSVNGSSWNTVSMSNTGGSTYVGVIPKFSSGTEIQFKVIAQDVAGNPTESNVVTYFVAVFISSTGLIFFLFVLVIVISMGFTLTLLLWRVKSAVFCSNCGSKLTSRATFCPKCGNKIK